MLNYIVKFILCESVKNDFEHSVFVAIVFLFLASSSWQGFSKLSENSVANFHYEINFFVKLLQYFNTRKLRNISVTQILREINFEEFKSCRSAVFAI